MSASLPQHGSSRSQASAAAASAENNTDDLRGKIVEIISTTANGCLTELGYYPGMPQQLQQALETNAHLRSENMKLFEDNRALAQIVATQNDRLAFVDTHENAKLQRFMDLNDQLRSLSTDRDELQRRHDALLKGVPFDHGYQALISEFQSLQAKHDSAKREHARMSDNFRRLYLTATANGILPTQPAAFAPAPIDPMRMLGDQQAMRQRQDQLPPGSKSVAMMPPRRHASDLLPQPAGRSTLQRTRPTHQLPHRRVSEGVPQNSISLAPYLGPHNSFVHGSMTSLYSSAALSSSAMASVSAVAKAPRTELSLRQNPAPARMPLTPLAIDARNLPITPISPNDTQQNSTQPRVLGWTPTTGATQAQTVIDLTNDDDMQVPALLMATKPSAPQNTGGSGERPLSPASSVEEPLALRRTSSGSAGNPLRQLSMSKVHPVRIPSPASSIEEPLIQRSKRTASLEGTPNGESHKKLRLDGSVVNSVEQEPSRPEPVEQPTELGKEMATGEIRLMSEQECVDAVFGEDEEKEGEYSCQLCIVRHERGAVEDPPKKFVQPTLDTLIRHCVDEHPAVWEHLRNSPAEEQD